MSPVNVQLLKRPVVQLPPYLELERTKGMTYTFDTVAKRMSVVVERVDTPLIAHMGMRMELYPVDCRVPQGSIRMLVVDLSP